MLTLAEGNGMGSSCKYSYLSGACANRHVDSLQCIGEDECEFAGLNVMTAKKAGSATEATALTNWLGLYCEKHGRFHSPGSEDCLGMGGRPKSAPFRRPHAPNDDEGP